MAELVWINGAVVPAAEATVSIFDHGLTVGDGVFETIKAVDGIPFALRRHLERLRRSAAGLGLTVPSSNEDLRAAIDAVLRSRTLPLARVRVTVTGGPAPLGSERSDAAATVVVAAGPMAPPAASVAMCVVPWPRNERGAMAGVKTTSYAENVVALAYARERDCGEALFLNTANQVCEGTGSNVFLVVDGEVVTPPLSAGCLAGVTRALVLESIGGTEVDIPSALLVEADEVFLTSTGRDVQAVHQLDGRKLAAPGPVTTRAALAFAELALAQQDP